MTLCKSLGGDHDRPRTRAATELEQRYWELADRFPELIETVPMSLFISCNVRHQMKKNKE